MLAVFLGAIYCTKKAKSWGRWAISCLAGAVAFAMAFVVMDVVFGPIAAVKGPQILLKLDDPVRMAMLLLLLLVMCFVCCGSQVEERDRQ